MTGWMHRRARPHAVPALAVAAIAALCAASAAYGASVGPTSSPAMQFGVSEEARSSWVAVSRSLDRPKVLYSVRLDPSRASSAITVRGMVQTAHCRDADLKGRNKADHPCVGGEPYRSDPLVFAKLVLATSPTATTGRVLKSWRGAACTDEVHHCPLPVSLDHARVSRAGAYVNLVVAARAPGGGEEQRVAVDRHQGQLQVIQTFSRREASRALVSGPNQPAFPASEGGKQAGRASERPAIIFSQPIAVKRGDVLDVSTSFTMTIHNSKDNAPFTGTSIYLVRNPAVTYSESVIVRRAGENCPTHCSMTRVGAYRAAVTGVVHVNVVVLVKDHEGQTNATVSYAGKLSVRKR